ncbi:Low affinity ammonium transporter-like protein [Cladobotryum mycophilum]|uniref:Low affinity ammonium transporter-like protein n=1 Tax=Cladobotryum mycophilum TaxID=491253 RepID=A0ABR0SGE9_9HYPO
MATQDERASAVVDQSDGIIIPEKKTELGVIPITRQATSPESPSDASTVRGDGDNDVPKHSSEGSTLPFSKARCIALVATATGAAFLNTLALQSVVIILPTIGNDLSIPSSRQQWIVSSYSLTFGCFLLFWGRIADLYDKRLIFILGSIWVTAVTAAQPFLPNEISFNVFRGLHGLGAAANVPTAIGILGVTFPPGKAKTYAFSAYAFGAPFGSMVGSILSGLVAQYASWKWVFGVLAILAGIISVAGCLVIPPAPTATPAATGRARSASIDWIGAALVTIGLLVLMFALTEGNVVGWNVPWIPVLIVVSILILIAFVMWQWYLERRLKVAEMGQAQGNPSTLPVPPLMKISIFRNLRISAVMVVMTLFFASFNNFLVFSTFYYQDFQGLDPLQTMLRFLPTGVGGAIVVVIVAFALPRIPTVFILLCGNLAVCISCLLFAVPISPHTSYFAFGLIAMFFSVVGADTTTPSLMLYTSRALPPQDQAVGGALINAMGQFGRAIGLAISTAIQTAVMADARHVPIKDVGGIRAWDLASLKGLRMAFWSSFAFGAASLLLVLVAFRSMEIVGKADPPTPPSPTFEQEERMMINDEKERKL